jgi:hypothetical protein
MVEDDLELPLDLKLLIEQVKQPISLVLNGMHPEKA